MLKLTLFTLTPERMEKPLIGSRCGEVNGTKSNPCGTQWRQFNGSDELGGRRCCACVNSPAIVSRGVEKSFFPIVLLAVHSSQLNMAQSCSVLSTATVCTIYTLQAHLILHFVLLSGKFYSRGHVYFWPNPCLQLFFPLRASRSAQLKIKTQWSK